MSSNRVRVFFCTNANEPNMCFLAGDSPGIPISDQTIPVLALLQVQGWFNQIKFVRIKTDVEINC